jgi:hypothetical protein
VRNRSCSLDVVLIAVGLFGCADVDASSSFASASTVDEWAPQPTDEIDLLFMIDNSCSLTEEQASVVTEMPRILSILATGHDASGTVPDARPYRSIHVAIVDSDMGLGDVTGITTCDPGFGDDGLMQIRARHPGTGCLADYGAQYAATANVFAFEAGGPSSTSQAGTDMGCVAALGTDGCGFEHQLESPLKAISLAPGADGASPVSWTAPGYRPPTFFAGTFGHGDDPRTNGAFLRPDSMLAVILVTDEDDCSTPNPSIFSPDDPRYNTVDLNLRCHEWASELYPIERYVDGFAGLRARPERLMFGVIAGVPPAVAGMSPETILEDQWMSEHVNPSMMNQLMPVCISPGGRGVAYPARRITQVAHGLEERGARVTVQSVCTTDFGPAFLEMLRILMLRR